MGGRDCAYRRNDRVPLSGEEVRNRSGGNQDSANDDAVRRGIVEPMVGCLREPDDEKGAAYHQKRAT